MDWQDTLKSLAPTVATALLGPLGGAAVSAIGGILGVSEPTQQKIADIIQNGQMTPDQVSEIKKLEMKYQDDEKERGFKYADLAFQDRDSARKANVAGGIQVKLFWFSVWLIITVLVSEGCVLYFGLPHGVSELVVGRVLGLFDSIAIQLTNYWFGTSLGSAQKTELLTTKDK